ncbi:von Willebrand factor, type A [Beauveria brongniartii RCEF 3172]|uniref:von Willebrand factor, type A n=1 Tax=Beauveria brongniartii RCEF 3172 TaxID=1081107 RepID=A0A166ZQZ3_9HYPO|nr:von Willebrand factor, type A [Beauveria brongniartii RCEF 3172]
MASKLKSLYTFARNRASQETNDPPPAYTPAAVAPPSELVAAPSFTPTTAAATSSSSSSSTDAAAPADDDPFGFLCAFDTVFLIDDSSSMTGRAGSHSPSSPFYSSCWDEVADVLRAVVPICTARDADGIDLYFLNHRSPSPSAFYSPPSGKARGGYYNIRSADDVSSIFQSVVPCGITPTGGRLEQILAPYLKGLEKSAAKRQSKTSAAAADAGGEGVTKEKKKKKEKKRMNVIVITDGRPTDDPAGVLVEAASRLVAARAPVAQLGVQFFQVGRDAGARAALQELDDGLMKYSGRDIVDCVTWDDERAGKGVLTAEGILKVVLGAVSRRLDWKTLGWSRPTVTKKDWNY